MKSGFSGSSDGPVLGVSHQTQSEPRQFYRVTQHVVNNKNRLP